jgi:hypothetical protein
MREKEGTVQGTLVVCFETTKQVLAERQLRKVLAIDVKRVPQDRCTDPQWHNHRSKERQLVAEQPCTDLFSLSGWP